jgi:putative NIF3 family GTP cyclohydrolase 1 type 2
MKLKRLFDLAIKLGSERDPRPRKRAIKAYADSAILWGDPGTEVRKILVGIDIEAAELLLAERIREREGLDLVIGHHPEGAAYARLSEVMRIQVDLLCRAGLERGAAEKFMDRRRLEVERRILPQNHTRPVDAARLLRMPFACLHTPADNHVYGFLRETFQRRKPRTVQEIIDILLSLPEYRQAQQHNAGPRVVLGSPRRPAGKIILEMTGGTEGPKEALDKLSKSGAATLVSMHLSEEYFQKAKDANLNAVIAGHISSDALGLNLLLDRIEKASGERFQTISCSGFTRIRRN